MYLFGGHPWHDVKIVVTECPHAKLTMLVNVAHCRDLSADELSAHGQRQGADLLQRLLAVGAAFRRRSAPVPGHAAHDGRRRRRAA